MVLAVAIIACPPFQYNKRAQQLCKLLCPIWLIEFSDYWNFTRSACRRVQRVHAGVGQGGIAVIRQVVLSIVAGLTTAGYDRTGGGAELLLHNGVIIRPWQAYRPGQLPYTA